MDQEADCRTLTFRSMRDADAAWHAIVSRLGEPRWTMQRESLDGDAPMTVGAAVAVEASPMLRAMGFAFDETVEVLGEGMARDAFVDGFMDPRDLAAAARDAAVEAAVAEGSGRTFH